MDLGLNRSWCERLYRQRAPGLVLYGRSLGLSHAEAEDVLQETFRALLQLNTPPMQPDRYTLRAFRNRALNYRRSLLRRITREFESKSWFEPQSAPSDQEQAAMEKLAALPRDQREVIVLKIWHQHTFEEIGSVLGISPNTAAARYRYGLGKLRAWLPKETEEDYEYRGIRSHRSSDARMEAEASIGTGFSAGLPAPAGG